MSNVEKMTVAAIKAKVSGMEGFNLKIERKIKLAATLHKKRSPKEI